MTENLENVVNVVKVEVAGTVWCRNGGPLSATSKGDISELL